VLQYDASDNSFIGGVPAYLPGIPSLSYLNASNNQINSLGEEENWNVTELRTQLQTLDLSHNALTGEGQTVRRGTQLHSRVLRHASRWQMHVRYAG
jgi:Leucine-rich repeat (LRR) protein